MVYFNEALDNDNARATYALEEVLKLYIIERISNESDLNFEELSCSIQQGGTYS